MATVKEVLAGLPESLAKDIEGRIEDAALGNHLTEDEVKEIVDGIFHLAAIKNAIDEDEVARNIDFLTAELRDAVVGIFL